MKIAKTWNEINLVLYDGDEAISTRVLEKKYRDTLDVAEALLEYIDSIPKGDKYINGMLKSDREWVEKVLKNKA